MRVDLCADNEEDYIGLATEAWAKNPHARVYRSIGHGQFSELLPVSMDDLNNAMPLASFDNGLLGIAQRRALKQAVKYDSRAPMGIDPDVSKAWILRELAGRGPLVPLPSQTFMVDGDVKTAEEYIVWWMNLRFAELLAKRVEDLTALHEELNQLHAMMDFCDAVSLGLIFLTWDVEQMALKLKWPVDKVNALLTKPMSALSVANRQLRVETIAKVKDQLEALREKSRFDLLKESL